MAQIESLSNEPFPYKSMDYAALRKEGIALIQKYSGHLWTDFNDHDPGVTILEALCYALTELGYKAQFPLQDILHSSPDKKGFAFKENAFYTAPEIFPCQPITILDFRKLLIDRIDPVNNAWIFLTDPSAGNLFTIWLLLDDGVAPSDEIITEVRGVMAAHRNLCEDVAEIRIVPREACQLEAAIFIETNIDPEKAAARILFELEKTLLNPTLINHSTAQMIQKNVPLDVLFEGPEMKHGYFNNEDLSEFPKQLDLLKVMNTILSIEGVYHISDLSITFRGQKYTDFILLDNTLPIFLPDFGGESGHNLSFYKNDTLLPFKEAESIQFYEQLKSQNKRNYTIDTAPELAMKYMEGRFRNIANYLSIQHEFPLLYGIGSYGLAPGSSEKRKAQAKQLKGYLVHFEQILANTSAQLANLKKLFSIYPQSQTYFHQPLTDVPNFISLLVTEDDTEAKEKIFTQHYEQWRGLIENEETFLERRNDFLNHLLARFNVIFDESIYYDYAYFPHKKLVLKRLIRAKEYYLQQLVLLSRNRGRGINYLKKEIGSFSLSFKKQVELSLDIDDKNQEKLSTQVQPIVFDLLFMVGEETIGGTEEMEYTFSKQEILADFLKTGISKEAYKIEFAPIQNVYRILLPLAKHPVTIEMAVEKALDEASKAIDDFCDKLVKINIATEGFYVIEHLLLQPNRNQVAEQKDPFYNCKISLVFPSWSVRFQEKGFREQAEIVVAELTPAHVRADCFWIDLDAMVLFENTYEQWTQACLKDPYSKDSAKHAQELKALLESYTPHEEE